MTQIHSTTTTTVAINRDVHQALRLMSRQDGVSQTSLISTLITEELHRRYQNRDCTKTGHALEQGKTSD